MRIHIPSLKNAGWQALALWKSLLSMFKAEWKLDDYPIRFRSQPATDPPTASRLKALPWVARIINWPVMSGTGDTKSAALAELRLSFERFKETKPSLPRPGTHVPIEFAPSVRVNRHRELARDFTQRILGMEWAWISDGSSLWDFHGEPSNDGLNEKIRQTYGVDVADISSGNLADIFDRIAKTDIADE
jgi:hypothetical protein